MELTPQSLHAVEFREARRNGYNTRDVDDFIERVAAGVGHLTDRLRAVEARAEAADARLIEAQRELDEARRRPPTPEASETDETLRRTLVLAQRTADATIKEAKEEANRVLSEAREEAARTRAEAEADARRGAESARIAAEAEVDTLLSSREKLRADIEVLTKKLGEQRSNIRAGVNELQRLLDDPNALKPISTPPLAEVDRPIALDPVPPADAEADAEGSNGHAPAEVGAGYGTNNVASLQETPDLGPPTQPVPFGMAGEGRDPWLPSDLRPVGDEPLGPPPPPPAPAQDGDSVPGERSPEWGTAVFDPDKADADRARFGRRR
ncbi:MAG TPA: DivIVA domain-containing protein [Acidimicrobiales bacterium]|nr:DivIVA domain-containing protein [Acidimicrobiales bacterium]